MKRQPLPPMSPGRFESLTGEESAVVMAVVKGESICTPIDHWEGFASGVHDLADRGWLDVWELPGETLVTLTVDAARQIGVEVGERIEMAHSSVVDEQGVRHRVEDMNIVQRWYPIGESPPPRAHKGKGYRPLPYPDRVEQPAPAAEEADAQPAPTLRIMGVLVQAMRPRKAGKQRKSAKGRVAAKKPAARRA